MQRILLSALSLLTLSAVVAPVAKAGAPYLDGQPPVLAVQMAGTHRTLRREDSAETDRASSRTENEQHGESDANAQATSGCNEVSLETQKK